MNTENSLPEKTQTVEKTPNPPPDQRLLNVLYSLEELITKQTSLKFAFLRGAVYGLGTVIGATILIAVLGGVIFSVIESLAQLPLVGDYIENNATEYLEETQPQ